MSFGSHPALWQVRSSQPNRFFCPEITNSCGTVLKNNDDSFFAEPVDARREARFLAFESVTRLLIWLAEGTSLEERGVRGTVALYCLRPDLIGEAALEEIGHSGGRSRQSVHQLAASFRATTGMTP